MKDIAKSHTSGLDTSNATEVVFCTWCRAAKSISDSVLITCALGRKVFCSEKCFSASRRSDFKKKNKSQATNTIETSDSSKPTPTSLEEPALIQAGVVPEAHSRSPVESERSINIATTSSTYSCEEVSKVTKKLSTNPRTSQMPPSAVRHQPSRVVPALSRRLTISSSSNLTIPSLQQNRPQLILNDLAPRNSLFKHPDLLYSRNTPVAPHSQCQQQQPVDLSKAVWPQSASAWNMLLQQGTAVSEAVQHPLLPGLGSGLLSRAPLLLPQDRAVLNNRQWAELVHSVIQHSVQHQSSLLQQSVHDLTTTSSSVSPPPLSTYNSVHDRPAEPQVVYVPLPIPIPIPIFKRAPEILQIMEKHGFTYSNDRNQPTAPTNLTSKDQRLSPAGTFINSGLQTHSSEMNDVTTAPGILDLSIGSKPVMLRRRSDTMLLSRPPRRNRSRSGHTISMISRPSAFRKAHHIPSCREITSRTGSLSTSPANVNHMTPTAIRLTPCEDGDLPTANATHHRTTNPVDPASAGHPTANEGKVPSSIVLDNSTSVPSQKLFSQGNDEAQLSLNKSALSVNPNNPSPAGYPLGHVLSTSPSGGTIVGSHPQAEYICTQCAAQSKDAPVLGLDDSLNFSHLHTTDSVLPKEFRHRLNKFFIHIEREFEREYRKLYAENLALQERLEKYEDAGDHADGKIFQRKFGGGIQISQRLKQQYKERTSRVLSRFQQGGSASTPADFPVAISSHQPTVTFSATQHHYTLPPSTSTSARSQPRFWTRLAGHKDGVWEVTTGRRASARLLASASADSTVRVWSADLGSVLLVYLGHHNASINSARFHDDLLVTAAGDGKAHLLRLSQFDCLSEFLIGTPMKNSVAPVASGEDSSQPEDGGDSGEGPPVPEVNEGHVLLSGTIKRKASAEDSLRQSTAMTSASYETPLDLPTNEGAPFFEEQHYSSAVDGDNVAVIRQPMTVFQDFSSVDAALPSSSSIPLPLSAADFLLSASSNVQVVTGSWDRVGRIYDVSTGGQLVTHLTGHDQAITDVRCSAMGRVLTAAKDGTFRLWDFRKGGHHEILVQQCHHHIVSSAQFVDDQGERLLTAGSSDRTCKLWDLRSTRAPLYTLRLDSPINRFGLCTQTGVVALPLDNRNVKLMEVSTGHRIGRLPRTSTQGHSRMVSSAAWLEDSLSVGTSRANLFTASFDQNICAWNVPFQQ